MHDPTSWRPAVLSLLALAAMVCAPVDAEAQEVFVRVPLDLSGTATNVTLPFGEPFLLVGAAPAEYRRVDARYVEWTDAPASTEECEAKLGQKTEEVRAWVRDPQIKSDSFAVFIVEGLGANRRYSLCMETRARIGAAGLTAFQDSAYRILDRGFTTLGKALGPPPFSVPAAEIRKLQVQLRSALPVAPGQTLLADSTFFDTANAKVSPTNLILTTEVLTAQTNRALAEANGDAATNAARNRLDGLAGNGALQAIAGTVSRQNRVAGMDSVEVDRAVATARLLATGDPEIMLAAMQGTVILDPLAVRPGQLAARDSAEVAARAARLDSTYLRLSELRDLLAAVEASPALYRQAAVRRDQVVSVRRRVDLARDHAQRVRAQTAAWTQADAERRRLLREAAGALRLTAEHQVALVGTSISNFETRARQYVTADLGVAYLPGIGEALPYFGANFYLGALNKRVPVGYTSEVDRWALTVGITATSLARENDRDDLFSSYSVLLGLGRRMTDAIRVTGGGVVYRGVNDNPLLDDTSIALSPFFSLSFDFDARSALGRVGDILSK